MPEQHNASAVATSWSATTQQLQLQGLDAQQIRKHCLAMIERMVREQGLDRATITASLNAALETLTWPVGGDAPEDAPGQATSQQEVTL